MTSIDPASWFPDELRHAGRENLDEDHADRYDRIMDAGAVQEFQLVRDLGVDENSTVVDFGAGTGQFALEASAAVRRVVAVDISPVMLSRLERKLQSRGVRNVECVVAGFLTYRHYGEPADLVYSRFALHHLPDFWKALALQRMAAILRPGGLLRLSDVVYSFEPGQAPERLEEWMGTLPLVQEGGWIRADLEEHIRDEHSTFTWLLEPMLIRAGLSIEQAEYSADQVFARYLCAKRSGGPGD